MGMSGLNRKLQYFMLEHAANVDNVHCTVQLLNTFFLSIWKIITRFGSTIKLWSILNNDLSKKCKHCNE